MAPRNRQVPGYRLQCTSHRRKSTYHQVLACFYRACVYKLECSVCSSIFIQCSLFYSLVFLGYNKPGNTKCLLLL